MMIGYLAGNMQMRRVSSCTHDKYRQYPYMHEDEALSMMRANTNSVCWIGIVVKTCDDCGADISRGRRVMVRTVEEVLSE